MNMKLNRGEYVPCTWFSHLYFANLFLLLCLL
jgi:hypothetical protein